MALDEAGIAHITVEDLTHTPQMPGGRVKTLHPKIHGGILADRHDPAQLAWADEHGGGLIDLVVCNLYPFEQQPSVEMIDVGGPTMLRAAAKNWEHVGVVVAPADYRVVLTELAAGSEISKTTRRRLARTAFAHTAAYDAAIVGWFDAAEPGEKLPPTIHLALEKDSTNLRYGENPHQQGALYKVMGRAGWMDGIEQYSGVAMSYLNILDAEVAWQLVHDLGQQPAAAVIKHANPCGVAVADDLATAYRKAFECDERSAFGGIVALNREVDKATCDAIVAAAQADVVVAPSYAAGVIDRLKAKRKNTRILARKQPSSFPSLELRQLDSASWLVQEPHSFKTMRADWCIVTKIQPTEKQWPDIELAWRLTGHVKSNAIILVKGGQAVGIGAGQQNRVESGIIAAGKAAGRAKGGACASDAFYPFPDGIEAAAGAGVAIIIQPGGALRDAECIAKADELGLAMIFTGERHFLH